MKMHTSLMSMSLIALMATSTFAQAQNYSQHRYTTADEGRRFNDGTRVRCNIVGGLLGNQVGGGNGKKAATVLGAVAGGAAGRTIQGNSQQNNGDRRVERVCERR